MRHLFLGILLFLIADIATGEGFATHTLVKTPTGVKQIRDIEVGDTVLSCDFKTLCVERKVTYKEHGFEFKALKVIVDGYVITTTPGQLFYSPTIRKWVRADSLKQGESLLTSAYDRAIVGKIVLAGPTHTIKISVEGEHNFYISNRGILVHNFIPLISVTVTIGGPVTWTIAGAAAGIAYIASEMSKEDSSKPTDNKPKPATDFGSADWRTPDNAPGDYKGIKSRKGKVNVKTGEVWEKDQLHKNHWEVYKNKKDYQKRNAKRDRAVWNDGRLKEKF